jgi:hypothetical protein
MARSTVTIATRIDPATRAAVVEHARRRGTSLGGLVRTALSLFVRGEASSALFALSGADAKTNDAIGELIKFLGLPPTATDTDIMSSVQAILTLPDASGAPPPAAGAGATAGAADEPAAASLARAKASHARFLNIYPHLLRKGSSK